MDLDRPETTPSPDSDAADRPETETKMREVKVTQSPDRSVAELEMSDEADTDLPQASVLILIQAFLRENNLEFLFDGTLRRHGGLTQAKSAADLDAWLALPRPTLMWLTDTLRLEAAAHGDKLSLSDVQLALRSLMRKAAHDRTQRIVKTLIGYKLSKNERATADQQWKELVTAIFETNPSLARVILEHFIWQTQQKLLGREVIHHLMPIVISPIQGGGKSTFVRRFLEPLDELASRSVRLSDLADARSGDIFRYPVVLVDDMEQIDRRQVPVLKDVLTSTNGMQRRRLGTSLTVDVAQCATFIGTANEEITMLVADDTGHRRFASLRFRNGNVTKGGDPQVWPVIEQTDMLLLWRSVDAFKPTPLLDHLDALHEMQESDRAPDEVALWLSEIKLDSPEITAITASKGVKAALLYKLFKGQTNSEWSLRRFGQAMARHALDDGTPFGPRIATAAGVVYPRKKS